MSTDPQIIGIIGAVAGLVSAAIAIVALEKYRALRVASLAIIGVATGVLVWSIVTTTIARESEFTVDADRARIKAQATTDALADIQKHRREYEQQLYLLERQRALEQAAVEEARKNILGTWAGPNSPHITFHQDGTVSTLDFKGIYTYRFVDSTHLRVTGFYGLGFSSDFEVKLLGADQYVKLNDRIWRRKLSE
jgi:hypothetical protein